MDSQWARAGCFREMNADRRFGRCIAAAEAAAHPLLWIKPGWRADNFSSDCVGCVRACLEGLIGSDPSRQRVMSSHLRGSENTVRDAGAEMPD